MSSMHLVSLGKPVLARTGYSHCGTSTRSVEKGRPSVKGLRKERGDIPSELGVDPPWGHSIAPASHIPNQPLTIPPPISHHYPNPQRNPLRNSQRLCLLRPNPMHTMKQNHPPQPLINRLHFGHESLLNEVVDRSPCDGVVVGEDAGQGGDGDVGCGGGLGAVRVGGEGEGEVFFGVAEGGGDQA